LTGTHGRLPGHGSQRSEPALSRIAQTGPVPSDCSGKGSSGGNRGFDQVFTLISEGEILLRQRAFGQLQGTTLSPVLNATSSTWGPPWSRRASRSSSSVRRDEVIQVRIFEARRVHDATTPRIENARVTAH